MRLLAAITVPGTTTFLGTALLLGMTAATSYGQPSSPHRWLSEAPGEMVRLIDKGQVEIQIDDEKLRQTGKAALTIFRFALDFDYKFRAEWVERNPPSRAWQARITSWIEQPKVRPAHTICIGSNFQPTQPWQSSLMKHEMDHVAISTDPRLIKIIQRVLQRRKTWLESFEQSAQPTDAELRQRVEADVRKTVAAFETMIQAQYDLLDRVTLDGRAGFEDRRTFFEGLYNLEGLERSKFAFLEEVRSFVKDRLTTASAKKEVADHYQFVVPQ
jgi:hypothetical protein